MPVATGYPPARVAAATSLNCSFVIMLSSLNIELSNNLHHTERLDKAVIVNDEPANEARTELALRLELVSN